MDVYITKAPLSETSCPRQTLPRPGGKIVLSIRHAESTGVNFVPWLANFEPPWDSKASDFEIVLLFRKPRPFSPPPADPIPSRCKASTPCAPSPLYAAIAVVTELAVGLAFLPGPGPRITFVNTTAWRQYSVCEGCDGDLACGMRELMAMVPDVPVKRQCAYAIDHLFAAAMRKMWGNVFDQQTMDEMFSMFWTETLEEFRDRVGDDIFDLAMSV